MFCTPHIKFVQKKEDHVISWITHHATRCRSWEWTLWAKVAVFYLLVNGECGSQLFISLPFSHGYKTNRNYSLLTAKHHWCVLEWEWLTFISIINISYHQRILHYCAFLIGRGVAFLKRSCSFCIYVWNWPTWVQIPGNVTRRTERTINCYCVSLEKGVWRNCYICPCYKKKERCDYSKCKPNHLNGQLFSLNKLYHH